MSPPAPGGAVHPRTARQQQIVDHVLAAGSASAAELVELTGVSLMTVHRDVDELVRRGLVRKYRGGVSAQPTSVFESHSEFRRTRHRAQKAAIADAALAMVEPGSSIMVDDSSTTLALVERLHEVGPLTVVTNYLPALQLLKDVPEVRLIGLGGDYSRTHDSFGGIACCESVASMAVDSAFVSTSSMTGSMTYHQEQDIVLVKRAMIEAATRTVLLMDSSKAPRRALHQVRPLEVFDALVIDDGVGDDLLVELREHTRVTVAPT
ncbi:DeoR/GlpR family DNA-binding transcription regulator [Actinomycetospora sp. TBRC 11914]|uniref:DeoR/GlpR family DNA-binding transcription regulator n=1 Tax=Actinomycetospora sp. TBRC 11914 TaxID=2729387 RepID=UPI00145F666A|nr:DeoR/GlpR family DNA-binding transcription regulator [Actinomycetospora sp. TBRC 11914]NMO93560.1 DeoR/GlpR transcriptional regulator [Actinomycetospora sp. TBRC 11914]